MFILFKKFFNFLIGGKLLYSVVLVSVLYLRITMKINYNYAFITSLLSPLSPSPLPPLQVITDSIQGFLYCNKLLTSCLFYTR